jgi:hypothetical protein
MRIVAPFRDCFENDVGVNHSGNEASSKQHQKHIAERLGQTQTTKHENVNEPPEIHGLYPPCHCHGGNGFTDESSHASGHSSGTAEDGLGHAWDEQHIDDESDEDH